MKISKLGRWLATGTLGVIGLLGCAARTAEAGDRCFYRGTMFSDGAASCQTGTQYRCDEGDWRSLGIACADTQPLAASRSCTYGGIAFSTGSASCQAGNQFRCEDGTWSNLGVPCTLGDAPAPRPQPDGRTCMFGDVTVSSSSTVCKSGTTFLCNNGEWLNLGTLCR